MGHEGGGYIGQLVSLAGVKGKEHSGLVTTGYADNVDTTERVVMPANPCRKWAIIQNTSHENAATSDIWVQLGTSGFYIILAVKGVLQIDNDLPWWGQVSVLSSDANGKVRVVEASVEG